MYIIAPRLGQNRNHKLVIYPNPVNNELNLEIYRGLSAQTVQVVDAYGHVKLTLELDQRQGPDIRDSESSGDDQRIKINTSDWMNGVYFVQLMGPFKTRTKKILVQRAY